MSKSYSGFTFDDLKDIGIQYSFKSLVFSERLINPSEQLKTNLEIANRLPINTETAKSQLITAPILNEIMKNNDFRITYYAGYIFDVEKSKGLKGYCDFILTKTPNSPIVEDPIFCMVEAKRDNVDNGIAQCAAEMVAAQIFNERRGNDTKIIHGAVTSGFEWLFLRLDGNFVSIDTKRYYLNNLSELLGVLQDIVDFYK